MIEIVWSAVAGGVSAGIISFVVASLTTAHMYSRLFTEDVEMLQGPPGPSGPPGPAGFCSCDPPPWDRR